jgi:hypothetical protein
MINSGENSLSTWRHAPQGDPPFRVTTAWLQIRSAVRHGLEHGRPLGADGWLYEAFSTLQPEYRARLAKQGRADFVVRVGRVGFFAGFLRQVDQFSGFTFYPDGR